MRARSAEFDYADGVVPGGFVVAALAADFQRDQAGRARQARVLAASARPTPTNRDSATSPWRDGQERGVLPAPGTRRTRRALEVRAKAGEEEAQRLLWLWWRCRVYTEAEILAFQAVRSGAP